MNPNLVAIVFIVLIVGGALAYIIRAKKKGRGCIGCPHGGDCSKCKSSCASAQTKDE